MGLNATLFPDSSALNMWMNDATQSERLEEGKALEFAALVPTYCDRASYFAAVLPPFWKNNASKGSTGEWQRPWEAKMHFLERLQQLSETQCISLADVILNKLEWLFFPISVK